jgi:hypothetical protein
MITITLVALAAVNAIFLTSAAVIDNRHTSALTRALGRPPPGQQRTIGVTSASRPRRRHPRHPGGITLLSAVSDETAHISLWQLLAAVSATVLVVTALTTIPAGLGARRPVTETLQSELA